MKQQISHHNIDQLAQLARMAGAQGFTEDQDSAEKRQPSPQQHSSHGDNESMAQRLIHQLMTSFKV